MGFVHYPARDARDRRIRELRAQGLSLRAIAAIVGCHHMTVWEAIDPYAKARYNAQRAARNCSPEGLRRRNEKRRKPAE